MKLIIFGLLFSFASIASSTGITHSCQDKTLSHTHYNFCYNSHYRLSRWTSYSLDTEMLAGDIPRSNKFKKDPLLLNENEITYPDDYKNTKMDRGHLVPAADMRMDTNSMHESFYMTNIAPQEPGFNRGIWKRVENQVRRLVNLEEKLIIISGPIFEFKKSIESSKHLYIPQYFYKIIFKNDPLHPKMIAFLMKNEKNNKHIEEFVVSVDEIEKRTGIDFFTNLDDKIEANLESTIDPWNWQLH